MKRVFLIVGVPGSGKTWVCKQVTDKFHYVAHDRCWRHPTLFPDKNDPDPKFPSGAKSTHVETIVYESRLTDKPIITECPFNEREISSEMQRKGLVVIPIFIVETPLTIKRRYEQRDGKPIPEHFMTRANSIKGRAIEWRARFGTSEQVVTLLRELC